MNPLRHLFLALTVTTFCWAAQPDSRAIETEVLRLDALRIEALLKNDVKALEQLYADELVYVHSGGKVDTKKAYLASLAAGNLTYVSLRYDPPARVTVAGRDTAVVTGKAIIEAKTKSGAMNRVLTTTTVYVRMGGQWRIISYQGTPVQP
jgi:uncharacterized protein (TIGR02246 family)